MKLIEQDDKKYFHRILSEQHLAADDFELYEVDRTDPKTDEIIALVGDVTVRRKSTGGKKQYPIKDGSCWVDEFKRDLSRGVFD